MDLTLQPEAEGTSRPSLIQELLFLLMGPDDDKKPLPQPEGNPEPGLRTSTTNVCFLQGSPFVGCSTHLP